MWIVRGTGDDDGRQGLGLMAFDHELGCKFQEKAPDLKVGTR